MQSTSSPVCLLRAGAYHRAQLKEAVERIGRKLAFRLPRGSKVLLKPNLVTGRGHTGLACTHPEFVAAVAAWCLDQGAVVHIGDSPAFGTARSVMAACGFRQALKGMPVKLVNFSRHRPVALASGPVVRVASEALDCDILINLPRVKAHSQLLVSLAVKNYFGAVAGWRKPCLHLRYGEKKGERFCQLLVDLLEILPAGISLVDGVTAMHRRGPVLGEPLALGLVSGAVNPVAADTALLIALGVRPEASPLWRECRRRQLPGSRPEELAWPLLGPEVFSGLGFEVPALLDPVRFQPGRVLRGSAKRIAAYLHTGPR